MPTWAIVLIVVGLVGLVGIAVLGILAAGVFAGAKGAIRHTQSLQTCNIAVSLSQAMAGYRDEYGHFPFPGGLKKEDLQSNEALIAILAGKDAALNPKRINFIAGIPQAKGNPPAGGLSWVGNQGTVRDPWGNLFEIRVDHDGDDEITDPEGGSYLPMRVAVISKGEDGMLTGTNRQGKDAKKDNCKSW